MLAEGADKIVGEGVSLVNIAAYLAYKTLLTLGLRLGFNIALIERIGHAGRI